MQQRLRVRDLLNAMKERVGSINGLANILAVDRKTVRKWLQQSEETFSRMPEQYIERITSAARKLSINLEEFSLYPIAVPPVMGSYSADVLLIWNPDVVSQDDYVSLITALGDLARGEGGIGVERIRHLGFNITVNEGVPV